MSRAIEPALDMTAEHATIGGRYVIRAPSEPPTGGFVVQEVVSRLSVQTEKIPGGVTGLGWQPGQSGNPGGRPKGVGTKARELADGSPERLLRVLLTVAENKKARNSDRVSAAREFLDRGWGKAPAYSPIEDGDPLDLNAADVAIGRLVDELAARREAQTAGPATNGTVAGDS
mgnify:CR=1 FL=1